MSARGEVFLGDLAKAFALLRPGDRQTSRAMAELLGLGREYGSPAPASVVDAVAARADALSGSDAVPVPGAGSGSRSPGGSRGERTYAGADPGSGAEAPAAPRPGTAPTAPAAPAVPSTPSIPAPAAGVHVPRLLDRALDFSVTPTGPLPERRGRGLLADAAPSADPSADQSADPSADPLGYPAADQPGGPVALPPYEPLWKPDWARGVMFATVSTPVASRRLDARTLSRKTARHESLRTVPWQSRPSTRRGVQLLLDHGAGMTPFQEDRRWLRELAGSIAGRDRVEVLRFRGTPLRGVVRGDPAAPQPYRPPAPGTPVVLVSDLGRARRPFADEPSVPAADWREFIHRLLRSGCPAVCITPFPADDYPRSLRDRVALIPFDRRISLRYAQEALRRIRQATEARS
ncbi:hypothetical protein K378_00738 [Streptomyces sp. Amel2xB2]|uniref:hypothetical protein n=1 Tax=Streptomyces sp. Amel2xB2 TaxID=1305829 RepID=UPI000DB95EFB|nr:hypothetical protein [Streptomyces sp. Amel2xB2]RAJ71914.1 hypothetical protein K378_00738 [Streptomyces sp. Amel2xB2]